MNQDAIDPSLYNRSLPSLFIIFGRLLHPQFEYAAQQFSPHDVNIDRWRQRTTIATWALACGIAAMVVTTAGLAFWWWKSMEYVTTDDARIKAEIVSISSEIQGRIEALTKERMP